MPRISFGPFALERPIAAGGMGEIWRGTHVEQRLPVAAKVLTHRRARRANVVKAFKDEVRAVAGLDHPNIVTVFDYGRVPEHAGAASDGRLVAGSPYLVMELATHGSLERLRGQVMAWQKLRGVLLCLLDALAHAHARGVIHRDLKPGNVLLVQAPGHDHPAPKIADFGLAHALDEPTQQQRAFSGTPLYMAPEQFRGEWREYGPWTDLYAFGCLAYEIVTGRPPFVCSDPADLAQAHEHARPPPLTAQAPLPSGIDDWIQRLLAKSPNQRFRHAADAAYMLLTLEKAGKRRPTLTDVPAVRQATVELEAIEAHTLSFPANTASGESAPGRRDRLPPAATTTVDGPPRLVSQDSEPLPAHARVSRDLPLGHRTTDRFAPVALRAASPPLPGDWRSPPSALPSPRLLGAGLGLYGLRALPMVDRDAERDVLWRALHTISDERRSAAVVIESPAGVGKSRLASWFACRARELGGATVVKATHSRTPGRADGLRRMLAHELRVVGLDRGAMAQRVERVLRAQGVSDAYEWHGLAELIRPATVDQAADGAQMVRFDAPTERLVLVARHLVRLSRERPVICWLEDVQWGSGALGLAQHLLERVAAPILVVATVRPEEVGDADTGVAGQLAQLTAHPRALRLALADLDARHQLALVEGLLGFAPELAARVAERTGGNPLFAVQLIGDWVQRGLLRHGEDGFELAPGADLELPDDLAAVWVVRLERVLEGATHEAVVGLELAAVLGIEVELEEWRVVCDRAAVPVPLELLDRLVEQRLAVVDAEASAHGSASWSFVNGMLRESVLTRARAAERLAGHHLLASEMLRELHGSGIQERLGRHLMAAGGLDVALAPLLEGARERLTMADYGMAEALLSMRDEAIDRLMLPVSDRRWGEGWVLRSRLARLRGRFDEAHQWSSLAIKGATAHGWDGVYAHALHGRGQLLKIRGSLKPALERLVEAEAAAEERDERSLVAHTRINLGWLSKSTGDLDAAVGYFRRALEDAESIADTYLRAASQLGLAVTAQEAGLLGRARGHVQDAVASFKKCGSRSGVANCENVLGEIARLAGELEAAEGHYRRALAGRRAIGAGDAAVPELNLGLTLVERHAFVEAREHLDNARQAIEKQERRHLLGALHVFLLPCLATDKDWGGWDEHFEAALKVLAETGYVSADVALMGHVAGDIARAAGESGRARRAFRLVLAQWQQLGRDSEAGLAAAALQAVSDEIE